MTLVRKFGEWYSALNTREGVYLFSFGPFESWPYLVSLKMQHNLDDQSVVMHKREQNTLKKNVLSGCENTIHYLPWKLKFVPQVQGKHYFKGTTDWTALNINLLFAHTRQRTQNATHRDNGIVECSPRHHHWSWILILGNTTCRCCCRVWLIEVCQNFTLCFGQSQFVWKINDVLVLFRNCLCPVELFVSVNPY